MQKIHSAVDINGAPFELEVHASSDIDASGLTVLPGPIDPHVHFRTPGQEHKENWESAARAAVAGGYTCVFDMPNNIPSCVTRARLLDKINLIESQLKNANIPLQYRLYFGADKNNFHQIHLVKDLIIGIKVFMGSSTGELLMDDESSLHAIFAIAAKFDLLVAVHAEDEAMLKASYEHHANATDFCCHSVIRTPEIAASAVKLAIDLARLYGTKLYILHVSTTNELALIKAAKAEGLSVYAETSPHHLFLNTDAYAKLGAKAQMNPPLREAHHQIALFEAIKAGVIDTIGSDHAPHTLEEKNQAFGKAPSGVPGIETNLPLLLNAVHEGKLTLQDVVKLTSSSVYNMFDLPKQDNYVLVDLNKTKTVTDANLKTKCGWSPFTGMELTGWPVYTVINGTVV